MRMLGRDCGAAGGGCLTPETLKPQRALREHTVVLETGCALGPSLSHQHVCPGRETATKQADVVIVAVWLLSHVRLCNPMGCKPPRSSVHGILQARTLEWVAMPFARGSS